MIAVPCPLSGCKSADQPKQAHGRGYTAGAPNPATDTVTLTPGPDMPACSCCGVAGGCGAGDKTLRKNMSLPMFI